MGGLSRHSERVGDLLPTHARTQRGDEDGRLFRHFDPKAKPAHPKRLVSLVDLLTRLVLAPGEATGPAASDEAVVEQVREDAVAPQVRS